MIGCFPVTGGYFTGKSLKKWRENNGTSSRRGPFTGRKGLFVNYVFTSHIVGMKEKESESLLGFLYDHIDSPEYHCRFHWTPNAIAMWDNRITQHRVVADDPAARRVMQRITLAGEAPVF